MSGLKVYVDLMSQPARALIMFLRMNKIPHEQKIIAIGKGENRQEAYKQIHKFGKIPAIDDNGFKVIESVAILRYLSQKYNVPENWYPKDVVGQARVDEFLEWQHIGLRVPLASYFFTKFLTPMFTGKQAPPETVAMWHKKMEDALDDMEKVWLKDKPYVVGDKISIADLLALCEVEQTLLTGYNPSEGRANISAWLARLHKELSPHYEEVHKVLYKVMEKNKSNL